ncbi:MAG TPA: histidine kinase [Gryllotalpicola sp.]
MIAHGRRLIPLMLNAVGMALVVYSFVTGHFVDRFGGWLVIACVLAIIGWATVEFLPWGFGATAHRGNPGLRNIRRGAIFVGVIVSSLSQAPTNAAHMAPLAVILVIALSDEYESIWLGALAAAISFVLTPIGCVIAHDSLQTTLLFEAGNVVWVLIGVSRRQARSANTRNRELLAREQEAREQAARASLLADRQAAARDIHDVLAHSLGGLVVQLDAVEALLESGRVGEARTKATQARRLAAEGLADARRAVAALRSPDEGVAPGPAGTAPSAPAAFDTEHPESALVDADLAGAVERLLRAHRELGGRVDAQVDLTGAPQPLPASIATAFERALQETLSNARRHAPGEPVAAELTAEDGRLELTVSNRARPGRPRSELGGGHGLTGMAERFAGLDGGTVTAEERGGRFVVSAAARFDTGARPGVAERATRAPRPVLRQD